MPAESLISNGILSTSGAVFNNKRNPTMKRTIVATVAALIAAAAFAAAVQCKGTTKKGSRCKNQTTNASGYCYQHESQAPSK